MRVTITKLGGRGFGARIIDERGAQSSSMFRTEYVTRDSQKPPFEVDRKFDPKLGVHSDADDLKFSYDEGVFGPQPEFRRLDQIRASLRDPNCNGPDPVYSIVMDVGRREHKDELARRIFYLALSFTPRANWEKSQSAARGISMQWRLIADGPLPNYSRYGKGERSSMRRRMPPTIPDAASP